MVEEKIFTNKKYAITKISAYREAEATETCNTMMKRIFCQLFGKYRYYLVLRQNRGVLDHYLTSNHAHEKYCIL